MKKTAVLGCAILGALVLTHPWNSDETGVVATAPQAEQIALSPVRAPAAIQPMKAQNAAKEADPARPEAPREASLQRPRGRIPAKADPYGGMQLIDSLRTATDDAGKYEIIKVYRNEGPYPLLRVKEHWRASADGSGVYEVTQEMAGDHVLVRLAPGATPDQLQAFAQEIGASIRTQLEFSGLYVVQFDGTSAGKVDEVLNQMQNRPDLIKTGSPNAFMKLNH